MIIRKATLKDVSKIVNMWKDFMKYHDEVVVKKNPKTKPHLVKKKDAAKRFRKYIKTKIRSRNATIHIAEIDEKAVGYSLVYIESTVPIFKVDKIGRIGDLYVKKEFRGRGISSRFKEEAVKWFKKKGMKYMSIQVYTDNKFAHSIYKHWGFFDYHLEMRRKI
jgi:GNAT superfamily N-acetyltransferase